MLAARGPAEAEIAGPRCVGASTAKTHTDNVLSTLHLRDRVQATILAYDAGPVRPGT